MTTNDTGLLGEPGSRRSIFDAREARHRGAVSVLVGTSSVDRDISLQELRRYVVADAYARFRRVGGDEVLLSLGIGGSGASDASGAGEAAKLSVEWSRADGSSVGDVCRRSQWVFLALFGAGLVYRRKARVEWCRQCETTLSASEILDCACRYCAAPVEIRRQSAWYLKLSAYHDESYEQLDSLPGWTDSAVAAQRDLLGRVEGFEVAAQALDGTEIQLFTDYPEAIAEAAFVALSPGHPDVEGWARWKARTEPSDQHAALWRYRGTEVEDSPLVETEWFLNVPGVPQPMPVIVSAAVGRRYGQSVILGTPTVDELHAAIARRVTARRIDWRPNDVSPRLQPATRYRATDPPISRPRPPGTPIPFLRCQECGPIPVPAEKLPLQAVGDPGESQAADNCPRCGEAATREGGTFTPAFERMARWLPLPIPESTRSGAVLQAIQGRETQPDVLGQRMITKALRDRGDIETPSGEPYERHLVCGDIAGAAALSAGQLVDDHGAAAVRFALLFAAAPEKAFRWNEADLRHCARFLERLRAYATPRLREPCSDDSTPRFDTADPLHRRLASWCGTAVERVTENLAALDTHRAARNVIALFDRIEDFEARVIAKRTELMDGDRRAVACALLVLTELIEPLVPDIGEELRDSAARAS